MCAQHLRNREHDVGGGCASGDFTLQLEANNTRDQHRNRLAKHGCFGFNTTDAPAKHAETVDHCGVRVSADASVGVGHLRAVGFILDENRAGEVLNVDLVNDAG